MNKQIGKQTDRHANSSDLCQGRLSTYFGLGKVSMMFYLEEHEVHVQGGDKQLVSLET